MDTELITDSTDSSDSSELTDMDTDSTYSTVSENDFTNEIEQLCSQFDSIKNIHEDVIQQLSSIQELIAEPTTIYVMYENNPYTLEDALELLYEKSEKQIDETGSHTFTEFLLGIL
jgi:hypothetical protein